MSACLSLLWGDENSLAEYALPFPSIQAAPPRVGGRAEEEGHPEWRGSDTCGPAGVGAGPCEEDVQAGLGQPSPHCRPGPRPGSCADQRRHSLGLPTLGSSRQPLGAWSLHQFQGLHDGWEEDKREFMPSAEPWAWHPVCARVRYYFLNLSLLLKLW